MLNIYDVITHGCAGSDHSSVASCVQGQLDHPWLVARVLLRLARNVHQCELPQNVQRSNCFLFKPSEWLAVDFAVCRLHGYFCTPGAQTHRQHVRRNVALKLLPLVSMQDQFDPSSISDLLGELNTYWVSYTAGPATCNNASFSANEKFWCHEFTKHGTCALSVLPTQHDYFSTTLQLFQQHDTAVSGSSPRQNTTSACLHPWPCRWQAFLAACVGYVNNCAWCLAGITCGGWNRPFHHPLQPR